MLLDDLDEVGNFGYQSYAKKQKNRSPIKVNSHKGEHVKYEFIEKLLKQPDKDLTRKTLQEMTNLYQELIET